jgi:heme/copper-type cytochrome/quinol oxidase subunit 1
LRQLSPSGPPETLAPLDDSDAYYASVTSHGTVMAYVLITFFAMGFGYAVTATSLGRPVRGMIAACSRRVRLRKFTIFYAGGGCEVI